MDRRTAQEAIVRTLEARGVGAPEGVLVLEPATIEKPYGWVFFYNSRRYVETGNMIHALIGHGPVIFVAKTGEIIELGSTIPATAAISEVESKRNLR